jgi:hypothetical protein
MNIIEIIKRVLEKEGPGQRGYQTKFGLLRNANSEEGFPLLRRQDYYDYNHKRLGGSGFHFIKWVA